MQAGEVGGGIAARRKQAGLSQEELAARLGVTRQAVSRWENGTALPTVDNMVELAKVLDASVDELLQLKREEKRTGLSAEGVGRMMDEQTARQERRMKKLMWALIAASAVLVLGIVLSTVLGNRRVQRLEERVGEQIAGLSGEVSQMTGRVDRQIARSVEEALAQNRSLLADKGCRKVEYNPETNTMDLHVFAYPIRLEAQDATFYAVYRSGKTTVPAQRVDSGYEAVLSVPPDEQSEYAMASVYLVWVQDGETVTEKICDESRHWDEIRPRIDGYWTAVSDLQGSRFQAFCEVRLPVDELACASLYGGDRPMELALSILYRGEVQAEQTFTRGEAWDQVDSFTETIEWTPAERIDDWENVVLHAVLTDRMGYSYAADWPLSKVSGQEEGREDTLPAE